MARQEATAAEVTDWRQPRRGEMKGRSPEDYGGLWPMQGWGPCRGGAQAGVGPRHWQRTYAQERRGRDVGGKSKLRDWHEMSLFKKTLGEVCGSIGERGRHTACDSGLDSTQTAGAQNSGDNPREWGSQREDPAAVL